MIARIDKIVNQWKAKTWTARPLLTERVGIGDIVQYAFRIVSRLHCRLGYEHEFRFSFV